MGASTSKTRLGLNETWFVAAGGNRERHTEGRLATALLSNGQLPAPPLEVSKVSEVHSQNKDGGDHVLSNYF